VPEGEDVHRLQCFAPSIDDEETQCTHWHTGPIRGHDMPGSAVGRAGCLMLVRVVQPENRHACGLDLSERAQVARAAWASQR
jgi:hypothetical protein